MYYKGIVLLIAFMYGAGKIITRFFDPKNTTLRFSVMIFLGIFVYIILLAVRVNRFKVIPEHSLKQSALPQKTLFFIIFPEVLFICFSVVYFSFSPTNYWLWYGSTLAVSFFASLITTKAFYETMLCDLVKDVIFSLAPKESVFEKNGTLFASSFSNSEIPLNEPVFLDFIIQNQYLSAAEIDIELFSLNPSTMLKKDYSNSGISLAEPFKYTLNGAETVHIKFPVVITKVYPMKKATFSVSVKVKNPRIDIIRLAHGNEYRDISNNNILDFIFGPIIALGTFIFSYQRNCLYTELPINAHKSGNFFISNNETLRAIVSKHWEISNTKTPES